MNNDYCTEGAVQNILFHAYSRFQGRRAVYGVMNSNWKGGYAWECDFHGITYNGYGHEFEIKVSFDDFSAEFRRKVKKHKKLREGLKFGKGYEPMVIPQHFYFVVCGFRVELDMVPEHAGLIEITQESIRWLVVRKEAPKLNAAQINHKQLFKAAQSLTYGYFNQRIQRGILNGK